MTAVTAVTAGTQAPRSSGHTVLAVGVPALEDVIRERTAFYDASFLSRDPDFVHAHITVLAPWVPAPTPQDLADVATIAADTAPFDITLERIEEFPDGLIHLVATPDDRLRDLTARVAATFPAYPPYAGTVSDPVPHLTLDRRSSTITPQTVRATVEHLLPVRRHVDRLDLQWWANDDCRLLHSWPLGRASGATT